ncbi:YkgJ family cysteine cluster protein [Desulfococcaceae bacterium OttesenSCG-928-F15]|nr:YkgJ family cysteine cluster protein [Desulfococcaceae bacterium OttesenSCG-928-F15]
MENEKNVLEPLEPDAPFCFECHADLPCYNHCCHDISQVLYPYDILRLKKHLKMSSSQFLEKYCEIHDGKTSGFPVVTFKLDPKNNWACPFVEEKGCRVYEARPASCRIFPLARGLSRDRETGKIQEHYAKIPDPACKGFECPTESTPQKWLKGQDVHKYNHMNDAMMPLITLKNRLMPGLLDKKEKEIFIMGCYDIDGFREWVLDTGELSDIFSSERVMEAYRNEDALLLLALEWVRYRLFGAMK